VLFWTTITDTSHEEEITATAARESLVDPGWTSIAVDN
jgi:hypothetical protein